MVLQWLKPWSMRLTLPKCMLALTVLILNILGIQVMSSPNLNLIKFLSQLHLVLKSFAVQLMFKHGVKNYFLTFIFNLSSFNFSECLFIQQRKESPDLPPLFYSLFYIVLSSWQLFTFFLRRWTTGNNLSQSLQSPSYESFSTPLNIVVIFPWTHANSAASFLRNTNPRKIGLKKNSRQHVVQPAAEGRIIPLQRIADKCKHNEAGK